MTTTLNTYPMATVIDQSAPTLPVNPLPGLALVLSPRDYIGIIDMSVIVGFHMKVAGINWTTNDQLIEMIMELYRQGFLQVMPEDPSMLRLHPAYRVVAVAPVAVDTTTLVGQRGPTGPSDVTYLHSGPT